MTPPPSEPEPLSNLEKQAFFYAETFLNCLTDEGSHYITQLPASGLLLPAQFRTLRKIFRHFEQGVHEDPLPPCGYSQDQAIADDGGRPEESSEAHVNKQSTSHLPLDIVTGSDDESPTRVTENWADRLTISHLNQALISRELLSQNLTPPNQTPLLPGGHNETASAVPQKRGRPPNTLTNASSKKVNIYSKSWGAILTVEEFQLEDVFRVYLNADSSNDAARFFKTPPPPLAKPDR